MIVVLVALVIAALGISYIALTLPGSIAGPTTNTVTTSITISPLPNLPTTISYSNVYIPDGAAIERSVANFNPQNITVAIGVNNTVVWTNEDVAFHIVQGANNLFTSANMTQGQSWNYTFTTPGVFQYSDPAYGWLNGTVTVISSSGS